MTKSNIRRLFLAPPPTIEDILAGNTSQSSNEAARKKIPHKDNNVESTFIIDSNKIIKANTKKASTLSKRKEQLLDSDHSIPKVKKVKVLQNVIEHVKKVVEPTKLKSELRIDANPTSINITPTPELTVAKRKQQDSIPESSSATTKKLKASSLRNSSISPKKYHQPLSAVPTDNKLSRDTRPVSTESVLERPIANQSVTAHSSSSERAPIINNPFAVPLDIEQSTQHKKLAAVTKYTSPTQPVPVKHVVELCIANETVATSMAIKPSTQKEKSTADAVTAHSNFSEPAAILNQTVTFEPLYQQEKAPAIADHPKSNQPALHLPVSNQLTTFSMAASQEKSNAAVTEYASSNEPLSINLKTEFTPVQESPSTKFVNNAPVSGNILVGSVGSKSSHDVTSSEVSSKDIVPEKGTPIIPLVAQFANLKDPRINLKYVVPEESDLLLFDYYSSKEKARDESNYTPIARSSEVSFTALPASRVLPFDYFATKAIPPVRLESSVTTAAVSPAPPQASYFVENILAGLKTSATKRPFNPSLNGPINKTAAPTSPPNSSPPPSSPPSSLPTPNQSPPPAQVNKQGKKKAARQKKAELKKKRAKDAASKHIDAPKNLDDLDFETLLRQHERATATKAPPKIAAPLWASTAATSSSSSSSTGQQTTSKASPSKVTTGAIGRPPMKNTPVGEKAGLIENKKYSQKKFMPTIVCKYYLKGTCRQDGNCTFKHEGEAPPPPTSRTVCQFFKTGSCTQGEDCKFSHDLQMEPCRFFHMQGTCEQGDRCPYSHEPLNEERLDRLRKLTGPCRFYLFKGYCTSGDNCLFSHDEATEEEKKKVESTITACRFFHITKNCKQGNDCFYLHEEASAEQIRSLKK